MVSRSGRVARQSARETTNVRGLQLLEVLFTSELWLSVVACCLHDGLPLTLLLDLGAAVAPGPAAEQYDEGVLAPTRAARAGRLPDWVAVVSVR